MGKRKSCDIFIIFYFSFLDERLEYQRLDVSGSHMSGAYFPIGGGPASWAELYIKLADLGRSICLHKEIPHPHMRIQPNSFYNSFTFS